MNAITETQVDRIRTLAAELDTLGKTALEKASEAGRLLIECKERLKHGEWLPWLESNFSFTDRTARRWIKLAEDIDSGKLKTDTVSNLAEAYRITTEPKPVSDCPFEMPLPGQRLVLLLADVCSTCRDHYAAIEPMDETYVQVTWTENELNPEGRGESIGAVAGTRRGIHKDRAWHFLVEGAPRGQEWKNAIGAYVPWNNPKNKNTANPNLSFEFGWLDECFDLYADKEAVLS
jgi:hypothetical protein